MTRATEFKSPCLACGYELVGIPAADNCPECGLPSSVSREQKTRIPTDLRRTIRRSARAAVFAIATVPLALLALALSTLVFGAASLYTIAPRGTLEVFLATATLAVAACCWRITTPIPALQGPLDAARLRAAIRASLISASLTLCIRAAVIHYVGLTGTPAEVFRLLYPIVLGVTFAISYLSLIAYIRWLALAVPSRALRVRTTAALWQGWVAMGLSAAAGLTWLFMPNPNNASSPVAVLVAVMTPIIPIYLVSTACSMLVALINRLKSAEQALQPSP